MQIEEIKSMAIEEVQNPTFQLTKQFLGANKLIYVDGLPVIEDVIIRESECSAEVYFPVCGEDYYFVIYMTLNQQISVHFMSMSAGNRVYLNVSSEELELDELINIFGVQPTTTRAKGSKRKFGSMTYDHNGFEFEPILKKTIEVEDKLKILIDALMPSREKLQQLPSSISHCIEISYYGYKDQMWGIHFDSELIKSIADLGMAVDIDLYANGSDLPNALQDKL
jgi:hypothetical protein